MKIYQTT